MSFIRVLFVLAVVALIVSIGINFSPFLFSDNQAGWMPSKPFSDITSFVVSVTALIAMLAYQQDRKKSELENKRSRSEFFLKQAIIALNEVYSLLKPEKGSEFPKNDRLVWLNAARRILEYKELQKEIYLDEFLIPCRIHEDKIRRRLTDSLKVVNQRDGKESSLPPQYFYGISDWESNKDRLDELADKTRPPTYANEVSINTVYEHKYIINLAMQSVVVVYRFVECYPDDYNDLLHGVEIWREDWKDYHGISEGARKFVAHYSQYLSNKVRN